MVDKVDRVERLEEKYRMFFENMGEGMCIVDRNLVITFMNDKLCETSGYSRDELLGEDISSFFSGVSKEIIESEFKKRVRGKTSHYTLTGRTKKGEELFFSVCSVPIFDKEGKFNGAFAIVSDITGKKKSEDKLKAHALELEKEVKERTGQLVDLYKGITVTEERNRLAQEIHDGLAQTLATLLLKIELCERLLGDNPEKAKRELSKLKETLLRSIKATRHVIFELRLPRFHRTGFATVLKQYLEEFRKKTGVAYSLNLKLEESVPTKIQVGTYRIIREAMNNIRKHAMAKNVDLRLKTDKNGNLCLIIKDDGKGFDLKRALTQSKYAKNFGLVGMEEQTKLLGGSFAVKTAKGQGAEIKVKIPLKE